METRDLRSQEWVIPSLRGPWVQIPPPAPFSNYLAEVLLLVVLEMRLAKVVVAVVAVPARQGVADYALAYRFVVVVVFSWFCGGWFLLPWLWLHILCLKKVKMYGDASTRYLKSYRLC